jgi:ElaB/YqjD/DUF883 family membrane-anchored ribosome-binding protein
MDNREKHHLMQKITRELEDLKNSQTSVIKKIGQLETDNLNLNNKTLSEALPDIYENVDNNLQRVDELLEVFSQETDKFKVDNHIDEVAAGS